MHVTTPYWASLLVPLQGEDKFMDLSALETGISLWMLSLHCENIAGG